MLSERRLRHKQVPRERGITKVHAGLLLANGGLEQRNLTKVVLNTDTVKENVILRERTY